MEERPDEQTNPWLHSSPQEISKEFRIEAEDHLAIQFSTRKFPPTGPFVTSIAAIVFFAVLIWRFDLWQTGQKGQFARFVIGSIIVGAGLGWLLLSPASGLFLWRYRRHLLRSGRIHLNVTVCVSKKGVSTSLGGQSVISDWPSLYALEEEHRGAFYLWLDKTTAILWPARLFVTDNERNEFRNAVHDWSGREFSAPHLASIGAIARTDLPNTPA